MQINRLVADVQQREIDVRRELVAKQVEDNIEDLEDAGDFVKEQKEFKELTAEDMVKANEWLRQQGHGPGNLRGNLQAVKGNLENLRKIDAELQVE